MTSPGKSPSTPQDRKRIPPQKQSGRGAVGVGQELPGEEKRIKKSPSG
jgi:hypothetical protein